MKFSIASLLLSHNTILHTALVICMFSPLSFSRCAQMECALHNREIKNMFTGFKTNSILTTRIISVDNVKDQNLVISLDIEDEFVIRFTTLFKNRLRNLIKQDIQKTISLSLISVVVSDGGNRPQVRGW